MNRSLGLLPIALLCSVSLAAPLSAAGDSSDSPESRGSAEVRLQSRADQVAADIRAFANDRSLSKAKKEKRISNAVRVAVVAATAYKDSASGILGAANEIAFAAGQAAPAYAEVIVNAVAFSPAVKSIDGAPEQVRAAVAAGAKGGSGKFYRKAALAESKSASKVRSAKKKTVAPSGAVERVETVSDDSYRPETTTHKPRQKSQRVASEGDQAEIPQSWRRAEGEASLEKNAAFRVGTMLSARYDDNVYLGNTSKVSDTILTATPYLSFEWGKNAQFGGAFSASESFQKFLEDSAPGIGLTSLSANVGYSGASLSVGGSGSFQQVYQSIVDLNATQRQQYERADTTGLALNIDGALGVKTGYRTGARYSKTSYSNASLVGNNNYSFPLSLYYRITPKSDISLGYVYGTQKSERGSSSKDHYFNLGANGQFTPLLSGNLSVGYKLRRFGTNPTDRIVAFTGTLDYAVTPKTKASLGIERDFNISALGASTTLTSVKLGLRSDFTTEFSGGLSFLYGNSRYDQQTSGSIVIPSRTDNDYDATVDAGYKFYEWLSARASFTHRKTTSLIEVLGYDSNIVDLSAEIHY